VASLQEEIGKRRPGDKVNLTLRTEDGSEVIKEILLRSADGETALKSKEEMSKTTALGGTFAELTSKEKKELNLSFGVKVKTLEPGKLKSSGLSEGDIITKVNQTQIESVEQLTRVLNSTNGGILLEIVSESGKKEYVGFGL
jgi:PDZ domain-containing secreted protein